MSIRIGELSRLSGVSIDTIRYYEKIGLLPKPARTASGYREYNQEHIDTIRFILRAKHIGFTITEISELLFLRHEKHSKTCEEVKQFATRKLEDINLRLVALERIRDALEKVVDSCNGGAVSADHCNILNALDSCPELE